MPNFAGCTSYSPQTRALPPPGRRGSEGPVMQNVSKSDRDTAVLSVTVNPPNDVRKWRTSTATPGRGSCWLPADVCQSNGRTPQPFNRSGSHLVIEPSVPNARFENAPHSPLASLLEKLQSGT